MAAYNRWQNQSLYGAGDTLTDAVRKEPRGAFFGSIHGTLNHLLFGDQILMSRFAGTPRPKAAGIADLVAMYERWEELKRERPSLRRGSSSVWPRSSIRSGCRATSPGTPAPPNAS